MPLLLSLEVPASRQPVTGAMWTGTNKNRDVSTGPLTRLFARSLARSLAHFAHSLARGKVNF